MDSQARSHGPVSRWAASALSVLVRDLTEDTEPDEDVDLRTPDWMVAAAVEFLAEYVTACAQSGGPRFNPRFTTARWGAASNATSISPINENFGHAARQEQIEWYRKEVEVEERRRIEGNLPDYDWDVCMIAHFHDGACAAR